MKNFKVNFILFIFAFSFVKLGFAAPKFSGQKIAVPAPTFEFGSDSEKWIPVFVQGQITTNLQNYSEMVVVDRQNIDKAVKEQKLSMGAGYSEREQLKIGELVAAKYIVAVSIIKKKNNFLIDAKVNDTESGTVVGKAYSNPNCPALKLEDGTEIAALSYEILKGLGIPENKLSALKDTAKQKKEIDANANLAKGIVAYSRGTIVEAMAYYQKAVSDYSGLKEAASRLQSMTSDLSSGNIRERALNEISLRKEWEKIWSDYRTFIKKNYYVTVAYSTNLSQGKIDYANETVELGVPVLVRFQNEALDNLYDSLLKSYKSIDGDTKNWGLATHKENIKFPNVNLVCALVDESGRPIVQGKLKIPGGINGAEKLDMFILTPKAEKITDKISVKITADVAMNLFINNDLFVLKRFFKTTKGKAKIKGAEMVQTGKVCNTNWKYPLSKPTLDWAGSGTERDPYIISTAQQLANLAYMVNSGESYKNKFFALNADINLNPGVRISENANARQWIPIGVDFTDSESFAGVFDGRFHRIDGLYINGYFDEAGLFGNVDGGTIKNLIMGNGLVYNKGSYYDEKEDLFYGGSSGSIIGCLTRSNLVCCGNEGTEVSGDSYVGGLIGKIYNVSGEVDYCAAFLYNKAKTSGRWHAGGIIGEFHSSAKVPMKIFACYNTGTLKGSGWGIGGIISSAREDDKLIMQVCWYLESCGANSPIKLEHRGYFKPAYEISACGKFAESDKAVLLQALNSASDNIWVRGADGWPTFKWVK